MRPLMALVSIHSREKDYDTCIELLQQGIEGKSDSKNSLHGHDVLQSRLGEIFMLSERYQDAIASFQASLAMNPMNTDVQRALDRLERILRGTESNGHDEISEEDPFFIASTSSSNRPMRTRHPFLLQKE